MRFLFPLLLLTLSLYTVALGQQPTPEPAPTLSPLSADEKKLDYRKLLLSQPDYSAEESYSAMEGFGGYSTGGKAGKKGPKSFLVTQFFGYLVDGVTTIKLDPFEKEYQVLHDGGRSADDMPADIRKFLTHKHWSFVPLGVTKVNDQYDAIKVQVAVKGKETEFYLYFAKELRYLVVAYEAKGREPGVGVTRRLFNVSLDPPDNLFSIPSDYKRVKKVSWG
ncbi:MAG: hypothetical protein ACJ73D_08625 [Pyrinomonadaceae bacterium]